MPSVEGRLGNAFTGGAFGQLIAHGGRRLDIAAIFAPALFDTTAGGHQCDSFQIVNELSVYMFGASEDGQARPLDRADDFLPDVVTTAKLLKLFGFLMFHV